MRLPYTGVLLVLLLAPLAQAHVLDTAEGAADATYGSLHPASVPEAPSVPPMSDPTSGGWPDEVQEAKATAQQTARDKAAEADAAAQGAHAQAQTFVDERLKEAEDSLRPGHALVDETRGQVEDMLEPDEGPAPAEEAPAPATQAAIVEAWPQYAQPVMIFTGAAAGFGLLAWLIGQSASVGAGAAGTAAAARDGRRFLPFASPLFTRFERDTVLGHPKREAIYGQIIGKPGITLQDLCDRSGLSRTAVTHHLRLLEQQHLVVSKRVGRSRHFFENGGRYGRHQKDAYAVLHNDRSKEIHSFIAQHPGAIQKDLCGAFGIQASVAHWHVKRLLEANLVEAVRQGRTVSYFPAGDAPQPAYA